MPGVLAIVSINRPAIVWQASDKLPQPQLSV